MVHTLIINHDLSSSNNNMGSDNSHRPYQSGCLGCLSRVPCVSLSSWILLSLGCGLYVGGTVVALKFIRELFHPGGPLDKSSPILIFPYIEYFAIGISGITTVLGTLFLIINHFSSGETSRHTLITPGRNASVRCCDAFCLLLAYLLQIIWTLLLCLHVLPVLILLTTSWFRDPTLQHCVDFRHFGLRAKPGSVIITSDESSAYARFPNNFTSTQNATVSYQLVSPAATSAHFCGRDLANYEERSLTLTTACGLAVVGVFLVIISMLNFIICLAGNFKHVKELRHLPYVQDSSSGGDDYMDGGHNGVMVGLPHSGNGVSHDHHHHHTHPNQGTSTKMMLNTSL